MAAATDSVRLIEDPAQWHRVKWGWMESVRRDVDLSMTARLLAHVLVLDFANRSTLRCNPSRAELGRVLGVSESTVKRAIAELVAGGWITAEGGCGRGHSTGYGFLSKARIVPLRPGHAEAQKGGVTDPLYDGERGSPVTSFTGSQRGSKMTRKGVKNDRPYNNDINHGKTIGARADAPAPARTRETAANDLDNQARKYAATIEQGGRFVPAVVSGRIAQRIVMLGLLTEAQLWDHGVEC